jgi:hypothetical protein
MVATNPNMPGGNREMKRKKTVVAGSLGECVHVNQQRELEMSICHICPECTYVSEQGKLLIYRCTQIGERFAARGRRRYNGRRGSSQVQVRGAKCSLAFWFGDRPGSDRWVEHLFGDSPEGHLTRMDRSVRYGCDSGTCCH